MAYTIDRGSFRATKTNDPLVFRVDFEFTDDTIVDVNQAWLYTWKSASFMYNSNMVAADLTAVLTAAVVAARKPDAETTVETALRNRGTVVVRVNPVVTEIPQKVQIMAVDPAVVFKTKEQVV
jgi:hypothetical protein